MSQFRNEQGRLIFSRLFLEQGYETNLAIYSLSDRDKEHKGKVYPSLYRLYTEMSDVTEYKFANKYFESYQHWDALTKEDFFKDHIQRWRKELELKIKSQALLEIIDQANSTDPRKRMEAAKYLYEKVYVGDKQTKGRPSKQAIKEEAERQASDLKTVEEHSKWLKERQTH